MSLYICFCYKTLKVQFVECNAMQWHILPYHIWYIYRCSWCCANDLDIGVQPILAPTMSVWYFSSILCSFLSGTILVGTASLSAVYYLRPQQCWCLFQCTGLSAFKFFEFFHTYWYGDSNSRLRVIAMTWQIFPLPSCLTMDGIRENEKKKNYDADPGAGVMRHDCGLGTPEQSERRLHADRIDDKRSIIM